MAIPRNYSVIPGVSHPGARDPSVRLARGEDLRLFLLRLFDFFFLTVVTFTHINSWLTVELRVTMRGESAMAKADDGGKAGFAQRTAEG
jgi:hypothetical protein